MSEICENASCDGVCEKCPTIDLTGVQPENESTQSCVSKRPHDGDSDGDSDSGHQSKKSRDEIFVVSSVPLETPFSHVGGSNDTSKRSMVSTVSRADSSISELATAYSTSFHYVGTDLPTAVLCFMSKYAFMVLFRITVTRNDGNGIPINSVSEETKDLLDMCAAVSTADSIVGLQSLLLISVSAIVTPTTSCVYWNKEEVSSLIAPLLAFSTASSGEWVQLCQDSYKMMCVMHERGGGLGADLVMTVTRS